MLGNIRIIEAHWAEYKAQLMQVRTLVFMDEQQVSADLEWDGLDAAALHLVALSDDNQAVGCARLLADGSIGRMAVLKTWRGKGIGSMLLDTAIRVHQRQAVPLIKLSAQMHAILFYQKAGFEVCSHPYLDANIMHVDMYLKADGYGKYGVC